MWVKKLNTEPTFVLLISQPCGNKSFKFWCLPPIIRGIFGGWTPKFKGFVPTRLRYLQNKINKLYIIYITHFDLHLFGWVGGLIGNEAKLKSFRLALDVPKHPKYKETKYLIKLIIFVFTAMERQVLAKYNISQVNSL